MKKTLTILVAVITLFAAACGDGDNTSVDLQTVPLADQPVDDGDGLDEPLFIDDEPTDGVAPPAIGMPVPGDLGLTVADVLVTDVTGPVVVSGFYFSSGDRTVLCELLAESYPPQCGGATVPLDAAGVDIGLLQSAQGTTWSDHLVTVVGELSDGTFVAIPTAR